MIDTAFGSIWMDDEEEPQQNWQLIEDDLAENDANDAWDAVFARSPVMDSLRVAVKLPAPPTRPEQDPTEIIVNEGAILLHTHIADARENLSIAPDTPLVLKREKDNPQNRNAVAVYWQEQKIGYLYHALAELVSPAIFDGIDFHCRVAAVSGNEVKITLAYSRGKELNEALVRLPLCPEGSFLLGQERSMQPVKSCGVRGRPLYLPFLQQGEEVYLLKDESITSDGVYIIDQHGYRLGHLPSNVEKQVAAHLIDGYRYPALIHSMKDGDVLLGNIRNCQLEIAMPSVLLEAGVPAH